jgi:hypothetical protein
MGFQEHSVAPRGGIPVVARPSFDTVTITVHWISLLLVLAMIGTGLLYGLTDPWARSCGRSQSCGLPGV